MRIVPITLLALFTSPACSSSADPTEPTDGVAVVELFTSEGCNTCPPAEAVLADLIDGHAETDNRIFCLAFHVDYWDRLGWKDPFAKPEFTRRQQDYAKAMRAKSVYTPQAVVNGTTHLVGSDHKQLTGRIDSALKAKATATVAMTATVRDGGFTLSYDVTGAGDDAVLNIALVESGLSTDVPRGENAGRTLEHANVVRWFRSVNLGDGRKGELALNPPDGVNVKQTSVIAYVQQADAMRVIGAAELMLPRE